MTQKSRLGLIQMRYFRSNDTNRAPRCLVCRPGNKKAPKNPNPVGRSIVKDLILATLGPRGSKGLKRRGSRAKTSDSLFFGELAARARSNGFDYGQPIVGHSPVFACHPLL